MRKLVQVIFVFIILTAKYASGQVIVDAGNDTSVCFGSTIQLGIMVNGGTGPYAYQWSPAASLSSTVVPNPIASPLVTTIYTVTVTDNLGGTATDNISIQVNALPVVNAGNDTVACKGDYFYGLNATADTTGIGQLNYIWTSNNGMPMFGIGSNFTLFPQNSAMYYVEVSTYQGCKGEDSVYVTVDALDVEVIYTTDGILPDTLFAQVNNSIGVVTYNWNNAETTPFAIAMGSGQYGVGVYDSYGCYDSDIDTVYTTSMSVTSNITNSVCNGNSGAIDITVMGGIPPYQYYWSNNEVTEDISGLSPSTYSITITDNLGFFVEESFEVNVFDVNIEFVSDGIAPDTLIAHAIGGTPPYTYYWYNNGGNDSITNGDVAGSGLFVADSAGCIGSAYWYGTQVSQHFITASCDGSSDGAIDITATTLFPPLTYQWNSGQTTEDISGMPPGYYECTITDSRGVNSYAGGYIDIDNVLWGSIRNQSDGIFPDTLYPHLFTQLSPVSFLWDNGSTALPRPIYGRGVYSLEINAGPLGCSRYIENYIGAHALDDYLSLNDTVGFYNVLNNDSLGWDNIYHNQQISSFIYTQPLHGTITGDYYSGQVYVVNPGYSGSDSFTYVVCVTDTSGFSFPFYCDSATVYINLACQDCVWPGDANNDGLVDNNDLLPIGLAYSASGPVRANASIVWQGQPATDWIDTLNDGTNYKFVDCDGSGVIDADDTTAIMLNWGLLHPRSGGDDEWRAGITSLLPQLTKDTIYNADTVLIDIVLGDVNLPASGIYGLSFTFNYDALVVDTANVRASFGDSWLGTASDKISIDKNFGGAGQIKCALTRIDHNPRTGWGSIGQVVAPITTDNINGKDYYNFKVWISDIVMIDELGNMLNVNTGADSAKLEYEPLGINNFSNPPQLAIYPNPARQQLIVDSKVQGVITITDATGKAVMVVNKTALAKETLNVEALAPGIYYLSLSTNEGATTKKFAIIR
jgi:hypothetical protein